MTPPMADAQAALITPYGMAAMAVIRVVGPDAPNLIRRVFHPARGRWPDPWDRSRLIYGRIGDGDQRIDDAIVCVDARDDSCRVDVTVHGGVRIVERVLMLLHDQGANIRDEPISDPAASWIHADIDRAFASAKTRRAVRFIAAQRDLLPAALTDIRDTAKRDFDAARRQLSDIAAGFHPARCLVQGARVAIQGPANVGKSTLANRFSTDPRNLVSDQEGTTRDWVGTETAIDGIPIELIDTAGIRPNVDPLEREAIQRGRKRFDEADIQLVVLDGSSPYPTGFVAENRVAWHADRIIVVINKSDLEWAWDESVPGDLRHSTVRVSALTGKGCDELSRRIVQILSMAHLAPSEPAAFTIQQFELISRALRCDNGMDLACCVRAALETAST